MPGSPEIYAALRKLTFRERLIVRLAFGIGHDGRRSLCDIAKEMQCSIGRVRWIKAKAVEKLAEAGIEERHLWAAAAREELRD